MIKKPDIKQDQMELMWRREYSLCYGWVTVESFKNFIGEELNRSGISVRIDGGEGWLSFFASRNDVEQMKKHLSLEVADPSKHLERRMNALQKNGKETVCFSRSLHPTPRTSDADLFKMVAGFFDIFTAYCVHLFRSFYWNEMSVLLFEKLIAKKVPQDQLVEVLQQFSKPSKLTSVPKISYYFARVKQFKKRLAYLEHNFPWLGSGDSFFPPMTRVQMGAYIRSFILPARNASAPVRLVLNAKEKRFLKRYQEILYIKDLRDDYRREAFYYFYPVAQELGRRFKLKPQDIGYLEPSEIPLLAHDRKKVLDLIRERSQGYVIEYTEDKETLWAGQGVKKYFFKNESKKNETQLQGTVGCVGAARGRVQIVRTSADRKNFKKGNVLVAVTTNPEYVTAMQKACALVTDEGGLTCHAAIVAREMKMPCVVGTKNATTVFKNGDYVEVDGSAGIVRKLKKGSR
ncbi:MAG: Phosphoenolpyruvate synthase/pyruvate phosphate dikinase [Candidatus Magasanikbacteria bacterium GW2011_GWA2_45_39]|uniref:Phosphoenolpyruvate synthase/pyruvate phosphate dikinase n=2 Tax=Candidatus Magasanikiibacteriota TaxID=1752731 RepID=A0A0G1Q7S3_9BACT|nr:MAG: Phosphoenolpyruvate synthase/pyruvate phosphate dikinase [Candidatus Magasanikbacteria bacterium GW2011_GWA2_45_39]KKU13783.1 MAG: Phosphoenolpyruvate synthase/pyruvate phosphate dikinase [Candidatus Magasanikbacteria bacterium GW2011_GWC2_45_8]